MSQQNPIAGSPVLQLIQQREQLNQWIARLDEVAPQASSRATERVRADYADRLRRVNEDLATHRDEIEADLQAQRGALDAAEQQRAHAADIMDEVQLRHLIGELDEAAWNRQRPELEQAVARADQALVHARGEVERLQALAADIAGAATRASAPAPTTAATPALPIAAAPAPAPAAPAPPAAPPAAAEVEDDWEPSFPDAEPAPVSPESLAPADEPLAASTGDTVAAAEAAGADDWDPFGAEFGPPQETADVDEGLPWLEGIDEAAKTWTPPPAAAVEEDAGLDFLRDIEESARTPEPPTGDLGADDLAFLEELDRAIAAPPASIGGAATPAPPAATPPPAAAPGTAGRAEPLLCKECGAINEPHSWYCEICGSEL
ncbi:Ran-binding zinc finger domain-containing protein [Longimicrobium sp.]|jgi:hypothetical protein|uniref:zinc finger Ran-binding domain-containing protein n=1 Tax=Longimicrobium sp. TaxID=2029185 RepID=UPI002ED8593F